jgi:hypothetical protein
MFWGDKIPCEPPLSNDFCTEDIFSQAGSFLRPPPGRTNLNSLRASFCPVAEDAFRAYLPEPSPLIHRLAVLHDDGLLLL